MARETDFVSDYRQDATEAIKVLQRLQSLHREAAIMDYPNSLTEAAFAGDNGVVDREKLQSAMDGVAALLALLTTEFLKSFYTIRL